MAVRAGGVFLLSESGQALVEHPVPWPEHRQVVVAQAGLLHGAEQVETEIGRGLRDRLVVRHALYQVVGGGAMDRAGENREGVGVLAEVLPCRRVGIHLSSRIPARLRHGALQLRGELRPVRGFVVQLEGVVELHCMLECVGELERDGGRAALASAGRHAAEGQHRVDGPFLVRHPVDVRPVGQGAEEAGLRIDVALEPREHAMHARQTRLDEGGIVTMAPVVVDHVGPEERERWNELGAGRGIPALGDALRQARAIVQLEGVAHQAVVTGDVERDERLDARVTDILESLVIRAVEIRFDGTEPCGAPADFPDFCQARIITRKRSACGERIAGENAVQVFDHQRFVAGFNPQLHVAEGAEFVRREQPVRATVGQELVAHADQLAACRVVAVALGHLVIDQSLGVVQLHVRATAAGYRELGIGVGEMGLIEEQAGLAVRGYGEGREAWGEGRAQGHASGADYARLGQRGFLHQRRRARTQPRHVFRAEAGGIAAVKLLRRLPGRVGKVRLLPIPRISFPVEALPGPEREVGVQFAAVVGEGLRRRVSPRLPRGVGIGDAFGAGVAFQNETDPPAHAGERAAVAVAADACGDDVGACLQPRCEIHALVAPQRGSAPLRAGGDGVAVHLEPVTGVATDVYDELLRARRQLERLAEEHDGVVGARRVRSGDPEGRPAQAAQLGGGGGSGEAALGGGEGPREKRSECDGVTETHGD